VIRERIATATGETAVVGGRIALLPAAAVPADQRWFYSALLAFVEDQDPYKQGRIEIELFDSPLWLENSVSAAGAVRGMASGWEDRIVFHADKSPYASGSRNSLSFHDIPAGTMRVSYTILAAGAADSEAPGSKAGRDLEGSFRIWIHHYLPVARAAEDLQADQILSEQSLVFREEDVSVLQSDSVVLGDQIQGYKTLSSLKRGERIDGRRLQRILAVRAGDRVVIILRRPGLEVRIPGRALRSGSVGDLIDVRPESAAGRLQARIAANGEVRVESR
jgi:flagella basal body P-ring formation protein FlgA